MPKCEGVRRKRDRMRRKSRDRSNYFFRLLTSGRPKKKRFNFKLHLADTDDKGIERVTARGAVRNLRRRTTGDGARQLEGAPRG